MALDERTDPAQIIAKVGLRYRIRLTPRVRTDLADDGGGGTLTWRPVLSQPHGSSRSWSRATTSRTEDEPDNRPAHRRPAVDRRRV